jgi:hypothetical protein
MEKYVPLLHAVFVSDKNKSFNSYFSIWGLLVSKKKDHLYVGFVFRESAKDLLYAIYAICHMLYMLYN